MKTRKHYNNSLDYNGQVYADKFVLNCTNFKKNGYFLELGSRDPKWNNNSYILERSFGWTGVMVDRVDTYLSEYESERPNSIHIIEDASEINYKEGFDKNNFPSNLDFWQLDLEVRDNTALITFLKINEELLDNYKFATITMEHDIFTGSVNSENTRTFSRDTLERKGYFCVFKDILDHPEVCIDNPYEDWWVHPDLVDMDYIKWLQEKNKDKYKTLDMNGRDIKCFKAYDIEYD